MLTAAHLDHWHRRGWLALPRLRSPQAVAALKQRAHEVVDAFEPGGRPAVVRMSHVAVPVPSS